MIALLFFVCMFIAGLVILVRAVSSEAPPPPIRLQDHELTFTCHMQRGEVRCTVLYRGRADYSIPPELKATVNRWATRLENPKRGESLYESLNHELAPFGYCRALQIEVPEWREPEPKAKTTGEKAVESLRGKVDTVRALMSEAEMTEADLPRPLSEYRKGHVKRHVRDAFHSDDHVD